MIMPPRLKKGDTVAIISPSWCGPASFGAIYENGLKVLREEFGLTSKEMPYTRIQGTPKERASDINKAFADPSIKGIICAIGGDDSILVLPYLNATIIKKNPKVFMGFSDNIILTTYINSLGIVSYHGPTIMAGFSQMRNYPAVLDSVRSALFEKKALVLPISSEYSCGYPDWGVAANVGKIHQKNPNTGIEVWQGSGVISGISAGGCIEVFDFLRGTKYFPKLKGKILFLETSEEKPTPAQVKYMLRSYGAIGVLSNLEGIVFARAYDYTPEQKKELRKNVIDVVYGEFGCTYPILGNADFGHTDPNFVIPMGVKTRIDVKKKEILFKHQ